MLELLHRHGGDWNWIDFGVIGMSLYWIIVIAAIVLLAGGIRRMRARGECDPAAFEQGKQPDLAA